MSIINITSNEAKSEDELKAELRKLNEEFKLISNESEKYRKEEEIYYNKMKESPSEEAHEKFLKAGNKFRETVLKGNEIAEKMVKLFKEIDKIKDSEFVNKTE